VADDRLQDQCLAGPVSDPARGQAEVLHARLAGAGDTELVTHADGEDRDGVLLGGYAADRVGEATDGPVLLGGHRDAGLRQ
jgi:hypothetical protein